MSQFCTRCGKPLQPAVRFCTSCGGAVAAPATPPQNPSTATAPATPSQQAAQFTPVTASTPGGQTSSSPPAATWATVAAPEVPQATASPQFAPVDIPAASQPTSDASPNQTWAQTTPKPDVPASNGTPGTATPAQQKSFAPVSYAAAPPPSAPGQQWSQPAPSTSASDQQWSQTPPASAPNQQWSQIPPNGLPPSTPLSAAGQPPRRPSVLPKLIGIALVLILLVGAVVVGGVVYVGYKVRQKTRGMTQSFSRLANDKSLSLTKDGSPDAKGALQGLLNALNGKSASADGIPVLSSNDPVTPCEASSFPAQDKARVPFRSGTVFTTAWGVKYGDVEARNSIDSIDDAKVTTTAATQEYKNDNGTTSKALTITNQNCNSDYQTADNYITVNSQRLPSLMHDMTRYRLSDKAFQEIRSNGQTDLKYVDIWYFGNGVKLTHEGGVLTRVEPQDVQYPMIVNDQRVELPVIHLKGDITPVGKDPRPLNQRPTKSDGEIFVLDDPANPLVLNWRLKDPLYHNGNFRVEIIKINYPVAKPENVLEKQLTQERRAVTYGIYFDFNRDTLKSESEPVLKQIAQAMTDNPDWKLTVEGHTDNVGGDPYNLELSRRRAAAVKQALVSQYNIAPDRLLTGGFGASRPVETNDTLEGRARNRRVELVRQ
jgi:outer membrane protein OmpA-like peptidoglycan-associated protein